MIAALRVGCLAARLPGRAPARGPTSRLRLPGRQTTYWCPQMERAPRAMRARTALSSCGGSNFQGVSWEARGI